MDRFIVKHRRIGELLADINVLVIVIKIPLIRHTGLQSASAEMRSQFRQLIHTLLRGQIVVGASPTTSVPQIGNILTEFGQGRLIVRRHLHHPIMFAISGVHYFKGE